MSTELLRTSRSKRMWSIATAVTALSLLISGCGTTPDTETDKNKAQTTLNVGFPVALQTLDLGTNTTIFNYYQAALVQEGLVAVDDAGALQPAIAKEWHQVDDLHYVYKIRDDAKFQDGTPLTMEDVLFSFELSGDEELSPNTAWGFANIDAVTETADHELSVTLKTPDASFPWTMSNAGALFITSKKYYEKHKADFGTAAAPPLGTGPYRVSEFVPESHIDYVASDTWWGGKVATKKVRIDFLPDANTRMLAMQSGKIDAALNVPIDQLGSWQKIPGVRIIDAPDQSYVGLVFKQRVAPFDDIHVRQAIAHALDADTIVQEVLQGKGEVATGLTSPELLTGTYTIEEARKLTAKVPRLKFDMAEAKAELAKSSVPEGFSFEVVTQNSNPQIGDAMQLLADRLKELNIKMTVLQNEQWGEALRDDKHGVGVIYSFATTSDPGERTSFLLAPDNLFQYVNDEVTSLVTASLTETDPVKRIDLLLTANQRQVDNILHLPLWWGRMSVAVSGKMQVKDLAAYTLLSQWADRFTQG